VKPRENSMTEEPNHTTTVRLRPRADGGPVRAGDMITVSPEDEDHAIGLDPLEELLSIDLAKSMEEEIDLSPRFKTPWKVKAMSNEINAQLLERATRYKKNPRTQEQIRELDNIEFTRLVVAYCTSSPSLLDPKLYAKFGVDRKLPDQLVSKILLPGEVDRLASTIMRLSGFRDDLVTVAKNSSNGEV
jgi:hypothetical protein